MKGKGRGRPGSNSKIPILKAISSATPPITVNRVYLAEYTIPANSPFIRADLECPVCHCILCQPVKLGCDNVVCSRCCKQWVQNGSLSCPCGQSDHPFNPDTIHTPSKVLLNLLGNLTIKCGKCGNTVKAADHTYHLTEKCEKYLHQAPTTPSSATPPSAALSEEKVASTVIRRLLSKSEDGATISVSTSGKVILN